MSFKGQGHKETPPRILQIIIWEEKKVSWFDDEDVYVAWFREISWKRNCVRNNKSICTTYVTTYFIFPLGMKRNWYLYLFYAQKFGWQILWKNTAKSTFLILISVQKITTIIYYFPKLTKSYQIQMSCSTIYDI